MWFRSSCDMPVSYSSINGFESLATAARWALAPVSLSQISLPSISIHVYTLFSIFYVYFREQPAVESSAYKTAHMYMSAT